MPTFAEAVQREEVRKIASKSIQGDTFTLDALDDEDEDFDIDLIINPDCFYYGY